MGRACPSRPVSCMQQVPSHGSWDLSRPLLPTALFVFCTKSRRAERYWQKTLLQMEEMESQIREEIRKGKCRRVEGLCTWLGRIAHSRWSVPQALRSCRQT